MELIHLRQEILLLGELQLKYKERLQTHPQINAEKMQSILAQAYEEELNGMEKEVTTKKLEVDCSKAKICDLEQKLAKKDQDIAEMKRMLNRIQEENQENVQCVEEANAALLATQTQLGMEIMQLQDSLARATRPINKLSVRGGSAGQHGASSSSAGSSGMGHSGTVGIAITGGAGALHSAGVDILSGRHHRPRDKSSSTLGSDDKSFIVGSPPLSSEETSEIADLAMRRMLYQQRNLDGDFDRSSMVAQEAREDENKSPEIGSAVSAKENFGTSSSSSMNGRH